MLELNATLVAVVLNFIILMFVLNYYLYKPVRGILEERRSYVERTITDAESRKTEAEVYLEQAKESVKKANTEGMAIIEAASAASEKLKNEKMENTAKGIEEMRRRAAVEIDQYKTDAKRQALKDAASLSVLIAEKIIRKNLDAKAQKGIIDGFIESLRN